jgi:hypothetical protein
MSDKTQRIGTGYVWIDAPCPECGALVEVLAIIRSVLTVPQDDAGTVRVRLKSKAVDHQCASGVQTVLIDRTDIGNGL